MTTTEVLIRQSVSVDGWSCWDYVDPPADTTGNIWVWQEISGWFGGLDVRAAPVDRPMIDGVYDAPTVFGGRSIEVTGTLVAPDRATLQQGLDELGRVLAGTARIGSLVVDEGQRNVRRTSQVRLGGPTLITRTGPHSADWSLKLFAPDPLRYGDTGHVITIAPYSQGVGRVYSLTFNRVYGGMGASGRGRVSNVGNAASPLQVTFNGPVTNPRLLITGTSKFTQLLMTLLTDERVVIDSYTRTVTYYAVGADGVSRRQNLSADSTWLYAEPGNTDVFYTVEGGGTGTAEVAWRDAWI